MMKSYEWSPAFDGQEHRIELTLNRMWGKGSIMIDDSTFPIRILPFYIPRKVTQIFRLGEKQAILVIPSFGQPDIVIDRKYVGSGKDYVS